MKKTILLIATAIAFMFIGCGSGGGEDTVSRLDKNTTEDSSVDSDSYVDNDADVNNDTSGELQAHGVRLKSEYQVSNNSIVLKTTYTYDSDGRVLNWESDFYANKKLTQKFITELYRKNNRVDFLTYKLYDNQDRLIEESRTDIFYNNLNLKYQMKQINKNYIDPLKNSKIITTVENWDGVYETEKNIKYYDVNDFLTSTTSYEAVWDGDKVFTLNQSRTVVKDNLTFYFSSRYYYNEEGKRSPEAYIDGEDSTKYGYDLLGTPYLIEKVITIYNGVKSTAIPRKSAIFNDEGLLIREDISADLYMTYEYENY